MKTKTQRLDVRLSESETKALERIAKKSKLSYSDIVRRLINDCRICEAPPVEYYELIVELRNVGSKLNQVLKLAYSQDRIDADLLKKTIDAYRDTEHRIWDAFSPEKKDENK